MIIQVFLCFPIDPLFEEAMHRVNPYIVSLLTSGGTYLHRLEKEGCIYLGKLCTSLLTFEELSLISEHMRSLLKKIAPSYLVPLTTLRLLALERSLK